MVKRYYTIRVSRTVAHVFCLCFAITFCTLLVALPSLEKSRQSSPFIEVDRRAGSSEHDTEVQDEPLVLVEYDPAEAAMKREEDKMRERAAKEARARQDAERRLGERERVRETERERERERYVEREEPRLPAREEPRLPARAPLREAPKEVARRPDERRVESAPVRIKLPNGMKGCARPSPYGRGYNVDRDTTGQINAACTMDEKEVTRGPPLPYTITRNFTYLSLVPHSIKIPFFGHVPIPLFRSSSYLWIPLTFSLTFSFTRDSGRMMCSQQ